MFHTFGFSGFKEVGGLDGLWEKYPLAIGRPSPVNGTNWTRLNQSSCYGSVEPYWANMFRYCFY